MIDDIKKHIQEMERNDLSPERMKDAAKILRVASFLFLDENLREKCEYYANLLDRQSKIEKSHREIIQAEYDRMRNSWDGKYDD